MRLNTPNPTMMFQGAIRRITSLVEEVVGGEASVDKNLNANPWAVNFIVLVPDQALVKRQVG